MSESSVNGIQSDIIFGPVPSRRLGRSLGINNIPSKICTYSCVYCQVGAVGKITVSREPYYKPEEIVDRIERKIELVYAKGERIDYLAFVPDGEPTLDINLGKTIMLLKKIRIPIAVISNASLIGDPDVKSNLTLADWVSFKIDSFAEDKWRRINRPHGRLKVNIIMEGMIEFRSGFSGILATETMILKGLNDSDTDAYGLNRFLRRLQPDRIYLSVPVRPPPYENVKAADPERLNAFYGILSKDFDKVDLLADYEGNAFTLTGEVRADILSIAAVHPIRKEAMNKLLSDAEKDWGIVDEMLKKDLLTETEFEGNKYYRKKYSVK